MPTSLDPQGLILLSPPAALARMGAHRGRGRATGQSLGGPSRPLTEFLAAPQTPLWPGGVLGKHSVTW